MGLLCIDCVLSQDCHVNFRKLVFQKKHNFQKCSIGMQKGQSDVSSFQCQQMCGTIQTMIQLKQMCCAYDKTDCLKGIASIKNFCSGKCDKKITCSLPIMNNGCGYDTTGTGWTSACLKCEGENPTIDKC